MLTMFLAHQDATRLQALLEENGGHERPLTEISATIVSPPSPKKACFIALSTLHDITGKPCNIVARVTPAHPRECRVRNFQAQRLKSLEILAGGIAHTLNNALTGLMLNVQLAQIESSRNPELMKCLDEIRDSGRRLAEICQELSSFTRDGPTVLETLNFNDLLHGLWPSLIRRAGLAVILELSSAEHLPAVRCDPTQLRKVVQNLFKNALESIDGTGTIQFTTKDFVVLEGQQQGRYALLSVADTGCGMDEDVLLQCCDPFFTTKFIGRGLGLSSTVGIVRAHGGFVELQSSPGKGTTVRVFLPAVG